MNGKAKFWCNDICIEKKQFCKIFLQTFVYWRSKHTHFKCCAENGLKKKRCWTGHYTLKLLSDTIRRVLVENSKVKSCNTSYQKSELNSARSEAIEMLFTREIFSRLRINNANAILYSDEKGKSIKVNTVKVSKVIKIVTCKNLALPAILQIKKYRMNTCNMHTTSQQQGAYLQTQRGWTTAFKCQGVTVCTDPLKAKASLFENMKQWWSAGTHRAVAMWGPWSSEWRIFRKLRGSALINRTLLPPCSQRGGGSVYETKNEKNVADDLSCSTCRETTSCFEIWRLIFVGESVYLTRVKLAGVVG